MNIFEEKTSQINTSIPILPPRPCITKKSTLSAHVDPLVEALFMLKSIKNNLERAFGTLCFVVFAAYLTFSAVSTLYSNISLYWIGVKTEGTVIDSGGSIRWNNNLFYPHVRYLVNEKSYTISSEHAFNDSSHPEISDKIIVYYDAKEPTHAAVYQIWGAFFIPIGKLVMSVGMFFLLTNIRVSRDGEEEAEKAIVKNAQRED